MYNAHDNNRIQPHVILGLLQSYYNSYYYISLTGSQFNHHCQLSSIRREGLTEARPLLVCVCSVLGCEFTSG